jgi:hypothetical protein
VEGGLDHGRAEVPSVICLLGLGLVGCSVSAEDLADGCGGATHTPLGFARVFRGSQDGGGLIRATLMGCLTWLTGGHILGMDSRTCGTEKRGDRGWLGLRVRDVGELPTSICLSVCLCMFVSRVCILSLWRC